MERMKKTRLLWKLPEKKKYRNRLIYGILFDFTLWLGGESGIRTRDTL